MSKDFTIVPRDYIVRHIKTDEMLVITKDGDYAYSVRTERIPLVRCRECKHGEYREDFDDYLCHMDGLSVNEADWFCADGEGNE